jgi:hypothetical protein
LTEPLVGKRCLNESPAARLPESKRPLVSEVTVWVVEVVSFVQQTVVPGATVIVDGEKRKLTTDTFASPFWHDVRFATREAESAPPGTAATRAAAVNAVRPCRTFTLVPTANLWIRFVRKERPTRSLTS